MTWPEAILGLGVCAVVIVMVLAVTGFEFTWCDCKKRTEGVKP